MSLSIGYASITPKIKTQSWLPGYVLMIYLWYLNADNIKST